MNEQVAVCRPRVESRHLFAQLERYFGLHVFSLYAFIARIASNTFGLIARQPAVVPHDGGALKQRVPVLIVDESKVCFF